MGKPMFTPEELEELRKADEGLEAEFALTPEEMAASRELDKQATLDGKDNREKEKLLRSRAEKKRWRESHREQDRANGRRYRERHREQIAKRRRERYLRNRERELARQREYDRAHKEQRAEKARERYKEQKEAKQHGAV